MSPTLRPATGRYAARATAGSSGSRFGWADSAGRSLCVRVSLSDSTTSQAPENMAYGKYHRRMFMMASGCVAPSGPPQQAADLV
jgi:hypothetical protein